MNTVVITIVFLLTWVFTVHARCRWRPAVPWYPEWIPQRGDLLCDRYCDDRRDLIHEPLFEYQTLDNCCTCHSCTTWEGQEVELFIEHVSVLGKTLVISREQYNNESVYKLEQRNSRMTALPSNLCDWDDDQRLKQKYPDQFHDMKQFREQIVYMDFQNNDIHHLPDLNCLKRLDKLYLRYNKVTHVSNTSFQYLSHLRVLDLAFNQIRTIEPKTLYQPTLNLLYADFSNNKMETADITNGITINPFCFIDYSNNLINKMINELNYKLNTSFNYGLGFVSLTNNIFEQFPDFKDLFNLNDLSEISTLFDGGYDFRNIKLTCDCHVEPFRSLAANKTRSFWRDYHNVTCANPPELKGRPVLDVPPEQMVCPLTAESNCPRGCSCVDHSKKDTLYVDCSYLNLDSLPDTLPESKFSSRIVLDVSGNLLPDLDNRTYLPKVSHLNISNNMLTEIDNEIMDHLENATLDISNNRHLRKIPSKFQFRNLCSTILTNDTIDCDCSNRWIETWVQTKGCDSVPIFSCQLANGSLISANDFRKDMLICSENYIILMVITITISVIALLLSMLGLITYKYRYEFLIIWLRDLHIDVNEPIRSFKWDVAISLDKENDTVRRWARKFLIDELTKQGYKVFVPYRDVVIGDKYTEVSNEMQQARNFIVILTESYVYKDTHAADDNNDPGAIRWTEKEWKFAWHQYRTDKRKNLILINFDHISSFSMPHPQIRAFLRVGQTIQFGNHDIEVMDKILAKVGRPMPPKKEVKASANSIKLQAKLHANFIEPPLAKAPFQFTEPQAYNHVHHKKTRKANKPNRPHVEMIHVEPPKARLEVPELSTRQRQGSKVHTREIELEVPIRYREDPYVHTRQPEVLIREPKHTVTAGPTIQDKVKFYDNVGMIIH